MLVRLANGEVHGIDFGMVAAQRLDPSRYAITEGHDLDWFQWPKVEGDRNIAGYESICVPGAVAGFALAAERFGRLPWREVLAPAIALAESGMRGRLVCIPLDRGRCRRPRRVSPRAARSSCPNGRAPVTRERGAEQRLANPALTRTLQRLATAGPRDFYEGEIAGSIVADLAAGGCVIDAADLAGYQAPPGAARNARLSRTVLHAMPGLSGGPTYLAALAALTRTLRPAQDIGPSAIVAHAQAISDAYAVRLEKYGHAGATNDCTSHVSVIDADGNMAL
jgi:gamma-glutamyltranspeptidase/glutathione hydrolase